MKWTYLAFLLAAVPTTVLGVGFAHNENFTVMAPDQELAEELLDRADKFRKEVALDLFGRELPPNVGPAIVNVKLSDEKDEGFTWPIDSRQRSYHKVWLTTSRERALGSTLRHEITHVVLATRYPGALPEWAEEGLASLTDDRERIDARNNTVQWYAETGNWPDIERLFGKEIITADDRAAYAVASSVTQYLLSRRDKKTFLAFAVAGPETGWDQALEAHYGVPGIDRLQAEWRSWVWSNLTALPRRCPKHGWELTPAYSFYQIVKHFR